MGSNSIGLTLRLRGNINGAEFDMNGLGHVETPGVYNAQMLFGALPSGFHPGAVSVFVMSMCCEYHASEINGATNIASMGASGYSTRRTLRFEGGQLSIEGEASVEQSRLSIEGSISGEGHMPTELAGHSVFVMMSSPEQGGQVLRGKGQGALVRTDGSVIEVTVETSHQLRPEPLANPLSQPQYRLVTESGKLTGLTYRSTIHSIYDRRNAMEIVAAMS